MKPLPILALFASLAGAQYAAAQYLGPKTVYILPMAGGLDQYLAQALTNGHVLQVVADPKLAEVVMTDNIGPSFEQTMKEILPPPADSKKSDDNNTHSAFRSTVARGTFFLVDAKSRKVVWSDYREPPSSNSASSLNREAAQIIKKLLGQ
jgi:hypothetical protein